MKRVGDWENRGRDRERGRKRGDQKSHSKISGILYPCSERERERERKQMRGHKMKGKREGNVSQSKKDEEGERNGWRERGSGCWHHDMPLASVDTLQNAQTERRQ